MISQAARESTRTSAGGALIRRYPLISYFAIAFGISWAYVLVFLVWFPLPKTFVTSTPELFGPPAAAFIVTAAVDGGTGVRALLKRLVAWRVGLRWYAMATLGVGVLYFAAILATPGAAASFVNPSLSKVLLYPIFFVVILILTGPLFEEPGWRGFALPRLQQRCGALTGAVILGVLWAAWHAPQYLIPGFAAENGGLTISGVATFTLGAVAFSVLIAWVFNNTAGSVLIAILWHTALNFSQGVTSELFPSASFSEVGPVIVFGLFALLVVLATRGRLGYSRLVAESAHA